MRCFSIHFAVRIFLIFIFYLTFPFQAFSQNQTDISKKSPYSSWISKPPWDQLYAEGLDDQKGMGRIFVPAMTNPGNEPFYGIIQDGKLIGEKIVGSSFFLLPGSYQIALGTGNLDQKIKKNVKIERGQTLIIEPDWSAITIDVIDESRNNIKKDLQIYNNQNFENYGVIPAINPELGEQLQTLILPPGLYKIVDRGADPNTFVNFSTVLLESGHYTPYTVVISSQTSSFIGAGVIASTTQLLQDQTWKNYIAIHGSLVINSANITESEAKTNFSLLTQLENRIIYDQLPHYFFSNNLLELGALRPENQDFQISQDRFQLKSTYVYYLLPWIGGYSQLGLTTHIFETTTVFDEKHDVTMINSNGTEVVKENVDRIKLEPPLFPLDLKGGIGANITPLRTFNSRLNLRAGYGFLQTYNSNVFRKESDYVYKEEKDDFVKGFETSFLLNLAIFRNLTITSELDLIFPEDDVQNPIIDLVNISTISLTRNVSMEHIFRLNRKPSSEWTTQEHLLTVRISYFIF